MGEEVKMSEYDGDDGERVLDWESGLPSLDDLTPLSQPLIPPELASAFSISPVSFRTAVEVNQASQDTLSSLRGLKSHESAVLVDDGDEDDDGDGDRDSRKETAAHSGEEGSGRASAKRPRLVWTPQLHKRFVDVVGHLGIKNAVPKTIMQLMNVEGLTRENVASHLQKYRLYLKRMHGLSPSDNSPSASDHLFESAPIPPPPQAMMPMMGMGMGMPPPHPHPHPHPYHQHHHHYSMMQHHHHHQQHNDWAANNYASLVNYPHVSPSDN